MDLRVHALEDPVLDRLTTATREARVRDVADVVLGVAILAGNETQVGSPIQSPH
jgi:hypothetical protein